MHRSTITVRKGTVLTSCGIPSRKRYNQIIPGIYPSVLHRYAQKNKKSAMKGRAKQKGTEKKEKKEK